MSEEKNYVIGFDLGKKYAQVSFVTFEGDEGDLYDIPVCVCKRNGANQWFYGKEAQQFAATGKGILADDLLQQAVLQDVVTIDEQEMDPVDLLALFVKNCLSQLGLYKENTFVKALVISVDELTQEVLSVLKKLQKIALSDFEGVYFEPKVESLFYYIIHQPKELWSYEVGVLDFSEQNLKTYRVEMNRKSRPILTMIEDRTYEEVGAPGEDLSITQRDLYLEALDDKMCKIMESFLEGRIVTSIYLTGKIFEKEWYPKTLKLICKNRRVFSGSNLYSKGACLGGMEKIAPGETAGAYLYLSREKLCENVGVLRMEQGKLIKEILLEGGTNWFEAKADFVFMPGEDMHLPIVLLPLDGSRERIVPVVLPEMKGRDRKSLKFHCELSMKSEEELLVVVEDMGFGNFYRPDGRRFEEIIPLGGNV